jgi:hypothetical protein
MKDIFCGHADINFFWCHTFFKYYQLGIQMISTNRKMLRWVHVMLNPSFPVCGQSQKAADCEPEEDCHQDKSAVTLILEFLVSPTMRNNLRFFVGVLL